jgi:hypothetical protein
MTALEEMQNPGGAAEPMEGVEVTGVGAKMIDGNAIAK